MENEEKDIVYGDDLEKAIERYSFEGYDAGWDDGEYIPLDILKQLLDHFVPKWRKREDRLFKYKKFVSEQQLDKNISKLRDYVDINCKMIRDEIVSLREFMDEFEAQAAEVNRIIQQDRVAMEKIRMRIQKNKE